MKKGIGEIYLKTLPFIGLRVLVYLATALLMFLSILLFGGVGLLLATATNVDMFAILGGILAIAIPGGVLVFANKFVLYLIKTAHLTVITEYIYSGHLPENQFKYGIDMVKSNLGKTTVFAGIDQVVRGCVNQVLGLLTKAEGILSFIPGMKFLTGILNTVISIVANYVDEAILTLIIHRKKEDEKTNSWNDAAEGVVLYAQCWNELGKTSIMMVIILLAFNFLLFIVMTALTFVLPSFGLNVFLRIISAVVFTWAISKGAIDPIVTVAMVSKFHETIESKQVNQEWVNKITNTSTKFKELTKKAVNTFNDESEEAFIVT